MVLTATRTVIHLRLVGVDDLKETWQRTCGNAALSWTKSLLLKTNLFRAKHLLHRAQTWRAVVDKVRAEFLSPSLSLSEVYKKESLPSLKRGELLRLVCSKIPGCFPHHHLFALWSAAEARVWMHRGRLHDCHEFQRSGVSKSLKSQCECVRRDIHTHWYKHPHQSRLQVSIGNVTAFPLAPTSCCARVCVCVRACEGFGSLFVSLSLFLPLLFLAAVPFHWWGPWSCGELDALIRASRVFSKATLHVRAACAEESAALLIHILCKVTSTWCARIGGRGTWTIGVAHRDCLAAQRRLRTERMVNTEPRQTWCEVPALNKIPCAHGNVDAQQERWHTRWQVVGPACRLSFSPLCFK